MDSRASAAGPTPSSPTVEASSGRDPDDRVLPRATDTSPSHVRQRIADCGLLVFATHGYATAALQEIAELAGVTKPMVHYYFGSKEGLFRALRLQLHQELTAELQRIVSEPIPARAKLVALAHLRIALACARPEASRFLAMTTGGVGCAPLARLGSPPDPATTTARLIYEEVLREIMTQGVTEGDVRAVDCEPFATCFLGAVASTAQQCESRDPPPGVAVDRKDPGALAERIVELFWSGIARDRRAVESRVRAAGSVSASSVERATAAMASAHVGGARPVSSRS